MAPSASPDSHDSSISIPSEEDPGEGEDEVGETALNGAGTTPRELTRHDASPGSGMSIEAPRPDGARWSRLSGLRAGRGEPQHQRPGGHAGERADQHADLSLGLKLRRVCEGEQADNRLMVKPTPHRSETP